MPAATTTGNPMSNDPKDQPPEDAPQSASPPADAGSEPAPAPAERPSDDEQPAERKPAEEPAEEKAADAAALAAPPDPADAPTSDRYARIPMQRTSWRNGLLVLLICVGIYVPVMGSYGMFDPWETHYTEVARNFMARNNWLETWWQNGRGPEGLSETTFWTKPVGSFWMSGLSLRIFGYSGRTTGDEIARGNPEWAVRLPFFLCALFGAFCIYLMCARLFSRRAGILAGTITATAPMYFMIGRQAMTDMPYVGLIDRKSVV